MVVGTLVVMPVPLVATVVDVVVIDTMLEIGAVVLVLVNVLVVGVAGVFVILADLPPKV